MNFKYPYMLLLNVLVPIIGYLIIRVEKRKTFNTSFFSLCPDIKTVRVLLLRIFRLIPVLTLALFIIALARPQRGYVSESIITEGIDIVLAMDVSSSMKAEDLKPNRIGSAKEVAEKFIKERKNDRIGIVSFARFAVTTSPLTTDHDTLVDFLKMIDTGMINDGTAIGNAIAEATKRLLAGGGKSKVIILLTDGINNSGEIDPITAAKAAAALGIKIHTIGVGTKGEAPFPVDDPVFGKRRVKVKVEIDEKILDKIARLTGGKYFRATDSESLYKIYNEINKLEKNKIEIKHYVRYKELFYLPLITALVLLTLSFFITKIAITAIP